MNIWNAARALPQGIWLSLSNKNLRGMTFWWPVLIAGVVYLFAGGLAYYFYAPLVEALAPAGSGFWLSLWDWLLRVLIACGLMVVVLILGVSSVMIFAELSLDSIVVNVFALEGVALPKPTEGLLGEIRKAAAREGWKLLFLIPAYIGLFFLGLIPLIAPLALLGGAWLLAYQYLDVPFQARGLASHETWDHCKRSPLSTLIFGLWLLCFGLLFPLSLLLPPVATVSATWLVAQSQ